MSEIFPPPKADEISICSLPWTELHITPNRKIKNCCAQTGSFQKTNSLDVNIDQEFNSPPLQKIRESFLNNEIPTECKICYKMDQIGSSYKTVKSHQWMELARPLIKARKTKDLQVRFLDLRFSNLCNFACRTCDSDNSSRWEKIDATVGRNPRSQLTKQENYNQQAIDSIIKNIDHIDEIYIAGGEPLIIKEHYILLDTLVKMGKTNLILSYNTNLSSLNNFGFDLMELWSHFKQVKLYPSIDSIGLQGEYIREGFSWEHFRQNFKRMQPYILGLQIVFSAYNIFSINDLILWAHNERIPFRIAPAYQPVEISAASLPRDIRLMSARVLSDSILKNSFVGSNKQQILGIIKYLENPDDNPTLFTNFWNFNTKLDRYFKRDFAAIFPKEFDHFQRYLHSVE